MFGWKQIVLAFFFLGIILLYGVVIFGKESAIQEAIFLNAWTAAFAFFIFFGAVAGLIALVTKQIPNRMTRGDGGNWEQVRLIGKAIYIRNFVLSISIPIVVVLSLVFVSTPTDAGGDPSEALRNFIVLIIVVIGSTIFAAFRFWAYFENQYSHLQSQSKLSVTEGNQDRD